MNKFSPFMQAIDILSNSHETENCIPEWKSFDTLNFILWLTDLQKLTLQYISDQDYWAQKSLASQEASFISNSFFILVLSASHQRAASAETDVCSTCFRELSF